MKPAAPTPLNPGNKKRGYRRKRPGVASIILIGAILMMIVAFIGVVISFSGVIERTYFDLIMETPQFEYTIVNGEETGNETFKAYQLMRYVAAGIMGLVLIFAAVSKVLEATDAGIVQAGTANRMISRSLLFLLIIVVFPPMWDISTETMYNIALWIMNPLYSFDPDNPCPANWSDADILEAYHNSMYVTTAAKTLQNSTGFDGNLVCEPQLKVSYVFGQMLRTTEDTDTSLSMADEVKVGITGGINIKNSTNWMGSIEDDIAKGVESSFTNMFLGLTKALVAIQILIIALLVGIMADMLVGMIAAALPVFLMLSLVPKADEFANKAMQALPALLLLPMMSAIVLVVGAGTIAEAGGTGQAYDHIYTWITAIGVVFFAITLPTVMVPMLSSATQIATQVVSSAVQTSSMITGMAASSTSAAAMDARKMGMGVGGIISTGMRGFGGGMLHSMGSVRSPSLLGGINIGEGRIASGVSAGSGIGHGLNPGSENLAGVGRQKEMASYEFSKVMNEGHTSDNANRLFAIGIGSGWDKNKSHKENVTLMDNTIKDMNNIDSEMTVTQQKAVNKWRGRIRTHMDAQGGIENMTQEDMFMLTETMKGKAGARGLSEGIRGKIANRRMAEETGLSPKKFSRLLKTNSK